MFTKEAADAICEDLAAGQSLRAAAKAQGLSHVTVLDRLKVDKEFADQYARAREAGYALLADEIIEISDDKDSEPARARLQFDARRWMLSKMLPKLYGDKVEHEHKGSVNIVATSQDEKL